LRAVAPTSQGKGHVPPSPLFKMSWHGGKVSRRTVDKKLTKLYRVFRNNFFNSTFFIQSSGPFLASCPALCGHWRNAHMASLPLDAGVLFENLLTIEFDFLHLLCVESGWRWHCKVALTASGGGGGDIWCSTVSWSALILPDTRSCRFAWLWNSMEELLFPRWMLEVHPGEPMLL